MFVLYPNSYTEEGIKDPDWQTVESTMRQLDGSHSDFVSLGHADPDLDHILIGGGEGGFVVNVRVGSKYYYLLNPVDTSGYVRLGEDEFEAKYVVPYELALKAIRWFFEHQTPDPSLKWE